MSERTGHAHETFVGTWHNLDTLVDPAAAGGETAAQLDETIADLRDEIQIAGDTRRRLLELEGADSGFGDTGESASHPTTGELFSTGPAERE